MRRLHDDVPLNHAAYVAHRARRLMIQVVLAHFYPPFVDDLSSLSLSSSPPLASASGKSKVSFEKVGRGSTKGIGSCLNDRRRLDAQGCLHSFPPPLLLTSFLPASRCKYRRVLACPGTAWVKSDKPTNDCMYEQEALLGVGIASSLPGGFYFQNHGKCQSTLVNVGRRKQESSTPPLHRLLASLVDWLGARGIRRSLA